MMRTGFWRTTRFEGAASRLKIARRQQALHELRLSKTVSWHLLYKCFMRAEYSRQCKKRRGELTSVEVEENPACWRDWCSAGIVTVASDGRLEAESGHAGPIAARVGRVSRRRRPWSRPEIRLLLVPVETQSGASMAILIESGWPTETVLAVKLPAGPPSSRRGDRPGSRPRLQRRPAARVRGGGRRLGLDSTRFSGSPPAASNGPCSPPSSCSRLRPCWSAMPSSDGLHGGWVLGFAVSCWLGSAYGFLQGAWPFGLIEAIWGVVAIVRWRRARAAL